MLVPWLAVPAGGCILGDVDLEGLECPCAAGWVCDTARNLCIESAGPRPDGGVDAEAPRDAATDGAAPTDGGERDAGEADGGPTDGGQPDEGVDAFSPWTAIADGASLRIDLGPMVSAGWPSIAGATGMAGPVETVEGDATEVIFTAAGFEGTQVNGADSNDFGWPLTASVDSIWTGSFDGHDAALASRGTLTLSQLPPGSYRVVLFASRSGDDAGIGRLTRYTIGGVHQDLEVSDNTSNRITFSGVSPDAAGDLEVAVEISPEGTGRFAYLGVAIVNREGS